MNLHIQKNGKNSSKGFYIALGVCLIAVGVAAWTTYDSVVNYAAPENETSSKTSQTAPANNTVSGVYGEPSSSPESSSSSEVSSQPASKPESKPASSVPAKQTTAEPTTFSYPVGKTILQKFSADPVYCKTTLDWRAHTGIDLKASKGEAVKAIAEGKVSKAYKDDRYGNTLVIEHGDVEAWYCGLDQMKVKAGDSVTAGEEIGTVGTAPIEEESGPHLHFATKVGGNFVDPLTVLR